MYKTGGKVADNYGFIEQDDQKGFENYRKQVDNSGMPLYKECGIEYNEHFLNNLCS